MSKSYKMARLEKDQEVLLQKHFEMQSHQSSEFCPKCLREMTSTCQFHGEQPVSYDEAITIIEVELREIAEDLAELHRMEDNN